MKCIPWSKTTKEESVLIRKIVDRAEKEGLTSNGKLNLTMDIEAANITNPLKLPDLLVADRFNFSHDVCGIIKNINRETGDLMNCFLPRFSK